MRERVHDSNKLNNQADTGKKSVLTARLCSWSMPWQAIRQFTIWTTAHSSAIMSSGQVGMPVRPGSTSVTPNGDTTGPHLGMFKIDGEISPDGSLDFFIFKPHLGKTGRLWPVVGLPKVWMTVDRFHAVKKLDVYCYLHIRPDKDCISWKHQDWDGYLHEVWKHRSIVRPLGLR